jgi:hypothetical protein
VNTTANDLPAHKPQPLTAYPDLSAALDDAKLIVTDGGHGLSYRGITSGIELKPSTNPSSTGRRGWRTTGDASLHSPLQPEPASTGVSREKKPTLPDLDHPGGEPS